MERVFEKLDDLSTKKVDKYHVNQEKLENYGLKDIELRPYQCDGVNWLIERYHRGHGCILGDEMGLGKTCQSISFVVYLTGEDLIKSPVLILAPLSVSGNWRTELEKFAPSLKFISYMGDKDSREGLRKKIKKGEEKGNISSFDVLLTTYEILLKDEAYLRGLSWSLLVVDEAHRLKNHESMLHQSLRQFDIDHCLLLTGTPVQNNLKELYSLLSFVAPKIFREKYRDAFLETFEDVQDETAKQCVSKLHSLLQPFLLRRVKNEVVKDLPKKSEVIIYHNLTALQKKYYKAILTKDIDAFEISNPGQTKPRLMNILMQLRKCVNHPYLFDGVEPEPFILGEHLIEASGKLLLIDKLLTFLKPQGHKVLLFSQMTRMLDIIQDYLGYRGFNYERLDGSVRGEERFLAIQNFNQQEDNFVFLLSTKAGGQGLNLTSADTVIFVDSDFNPQNDLQAAARAHRIGQTRPVRILRLIGRSTVEEIVLRRAEAKLKLTNAVIEGGQFSLGESRESLIADNNIKLQDILKFGLEQLFDKDDSSDESVDFHTILGASVNGEWQLEELQDTNSQFDTETLEPTEGPSSMYMFEGTDYSKETTAEDQTAFDNLIAAEKALMEATTSSEENRSRRRKNVTLLTGLPEVVRKSRSKLTPEQLEERRQKRKEAAERRAQEDEEEEIKHAQRQRKRREELWTKNGYVSVNITMDDEADSGSDNDDDFINNDDDDDDGDDEDVGSRKLEYVSGDVTHPVHTGDKDAIIIHCADDSGKWGVGGVFTAIGNRSPNPETQYELAGKMKDLALGDVHLIAIDDVQKRENGQDFLALLIVQHRDRHNQLSGIKLTALGQALQRVGKAAKEKKASVHLPRIGFKTPGFNWYGTERLIRKHLVSKSVPTFIYYYPRKQKLKRKGTSLSPATTLKVQKTAEDQKTLISIKDPGSSSRRKPPISLSDIFTGLSIYLHGLPEDEHRKLKRYIVAYDGDVDAVLQPSTTHIVSAAMSQEDKQGLIKLLDELKPTIVSVSWVEECLKQTHKVDETPYVIDF